ncbi:solute carrier family 26 member 10-like isoform X3 [Perognathus longimembris pacificus]|uniref:solute carrier family 26 member 10-like isoform X3 n=1 Tax=Perognathus longimembris pacificus TaxID=214514 RepID=UPI002018EEDD|nr:solute carrier family 26 member 10-like isoform X3 [Perognathus longimembris pacificus]
MSGLPGSRTSLGPGEASHPQSPLDTRIRQPLTEARFQQLFGDTEQEPELPAEPRLLRLCGRWRQRARTCSWLGAWHLLQARLPPLRWLPQYRWRAWALGDAVAGVTVGVVHVPQGMAFALLTSVPPVFGLYTSFFPVLIYSLLGTGRHLSTGTFAVLSLMTGSAVERLVPEPVAGNLSGSEREQLDAQRVGVAAAVAFGSGALMLGMFVLQLGVLSIFLSEPVVKALTSGAALHVLVSQLPSLLGLSLPRQIGCFSLFKTLAAVLTALPQSSPAELTISALSLALLVPVKELNVRFRDRLPTPIPGEVVMVLLASVLCYTSSLDTRYNVQVVGLLPEGFPQPLLPSMVELPRILADSLPIALVAFAVSTSLASIYADKYNYTIDPNQELLAHGVSNLLSSLFSCFPNSATLATTSLLVDAGGNTQAVWVVTWVAVVTLNVDLGLAVGVVFSMMTVVCRTQRVQFLALGLAEGTELYRPLRESHKLLQVPGLCILSYPTPLYFGTRGQFRRLLEWHLGLGEQGKDSPKPDGPSDAAAEPVRVVVLDFSGVTFVDAAGAREVAQLASRCQDAGIHLLLAQCNASVLETLARAGLLNRVTPEQLFVSVQDAAAHALERLVRDKSVRSGKQVLG